ILQRTGSFSNKEVELSVEIDINNAKILGDANAKVNVSPAGRGNVDAMIGYIVEVMQGGQAVCMTCRCERDVKPAIAVHIYDLGFVVKGEGRAQSKVVIRGEAKGGHGGGAGVFEQLKSTNRI